MQCEMILELEDEIAKGDCLNPIVNVRHSAN